MDAFLYWIFCTLAVLGAYALFGWTCTLFIPKRKRRVAYRLTGEEGREELRDLLHLIRIQPEGEMSAVLLLPASPSLDLMRLLAETDLEKYLPL